MLLGRTLFARSRGTGVSEMVAFPVYTGRMPFSLDFILLLSVFVKLQISPSFEFISQDSSRFQYRNVWSCF